MTSPAVSSGRQVVAPAMQRWQRETSIGPENGSTCLGLLDLPTELHLLVCSFLPLSSLQALSTANKILYRRTDLFGPLLAKSGALPPVPQVFCAFPDTSRTWRGTVCEFLARQLLCSVCKVYFDKAWKCPRTFDDPLCRDCGVEARTKELEETFEDEDLDKLRLYGLEDEYKFAAVEYTCIRDVKEALEHEKFAALLNLQGDEDLLAWFPWLR